MAGEGRYSKKFEIKEGGKNGTIPPGQFPVNFNNDTSPRFNPKGDKLKSAKGSMPRKL